MSSQSSASVSLRELRSIFDHTLLKPDATPSQIELLCMEALELSVAAVCVNPIYVSQVSRALQGSSVKCCTVTGFPLGASSTHVKREEARAAIAEGATEIDMVIWIGGLKAGNLDAVRRDIAGVVDQCAAHGAITKVIMECALLNDTEKTTVSKICIEEGAQYLKTSTGFASGGATLHDVALMSALAKPAGVGVKAAGGIRTFDDAMTMIRAGATRIGASATKSIIDQAIASGLS